MRKKLHESLLTSDEVLLLQNARVEIKTIIDLSNHRDSERTEYVTNFMSNSLDAAINCLNIVRTKL